MNNRSAWDRTVLGSNTDLAVSQQNFDASENYKAASQAGQVGEQDTQAFNKALGDLQRALLSAGFDSSAQQLAMQQFANQLYGMQGEWSGDVAGTVGQLGINAASGGGGGGGGGGLPSAGSTSLSMPTGSSNPYGVGVGGGGGGNPYGVSVGGGGGGNPYGVSLQGLQTLKPIKNYAGLVRT